MKSRRSKTLDRTGAALAEMRNRAAARARTLQFEYVAKQPLDEVSVVIARDSSVTKNQYVALGWYLDRDGAVYQPRKPSWGESSVFGERFSYVGPGTGPGTSSLRKLSADSPFYGVRIRVLRFGEGAQDPREVFGAAALLLREFRLDTEARPSQDIIAIKGKVCRAES